MRFSFARSAAGFWVASLAGFLTFGYVIARLMLEGMAEGLPHAGREAASAALVLGLLGALALGAPAALLFGGVMRRVRRGGAWPTALVTGGLLSAVAYLPLRSFAEALLSDWGYVREPALFVTIAAGSMMAGAVVGALVGRSSRLGRTPSR
jgi:hypothetical protein